MFTRLYVINGYFDDSYTFKIRSLIKICMSFDLKRANNFKLRVQRATLRFERYLFTLFIISILYSSREHCCRFVPKCSVSIASGAAILDTSLMQGRGGIVIGAAGACA